MVQYQILIGSDPNRLTDRLNTHAAQGYRLTTLIANGEELIAAMVRVIDDSTAKAKP